MPFSDEQAIDIYIAAVTRAAVVHMCVSEQVLRPDEVNPLRSTWEAAAAAALQQGKAAAELKGIKEDGPAGLKSFANMTATLYAQLPRDDRARRCQEALDGYRTAPEPPAAK